MNVSSFTCQVCNQKKSNYTCPRCNAMYCSLPCYKKHDKQCTTQFYSAHVLDYIKNEKSTKKESIDMAKKLKRFYDAQQKEDEEQDKILLQKRIDDQLLNKNVQKLQTLALDDDININDLTQYQQKEFAKAIKNGTLYKHINVWKPWWQYDNNNKNIIIDTMDINDDIDIDLKNDNIKSNVSLTIPPLPIDLPAFASLRAKKPSSLLKYLLCDILCGYIAGMIKYNGDWNDNPFEVFRTILSVSCVLSDNKIIHNNFNLLTNKLMENYKSQSIKNNKFEILLYLREVCLLFKNKMNVLRALNQIYELIEIIQSDILSKAKVSKSLNKQINKIKKKDKIQINQNNDDNNNNDKIDPNNNNYFDDHADKFMKLMDIDGAQQNVQNNDKNDDISNDADVNININLINDNKTNNNNNDNVNTNINHNNINKNNKNNIDNNNINDDYFDDHADNFMKLMDIDQQQNDIKNDKDDNMDINNNNANKNKNDNNKKDIKPIKKIKKKSSIKCYSSSYAPKKMRDNIRKKCKKYDPYKRKIWYYLIWCNEFMNDDKTNLLSQQLKISVELIHSKLSQMDKQIITNMNTQNIQTSITNP